MVLLLVFMQLTRDLFAIAKFLFTKKYSGLRCNARSKRASKRVCIYTMFQKNYTNFIARQHTDIVILSVCLSVRPSVRPSVTRWYCMKTAHHNFFTIR